LILFARVLKKSHMVRLAEKEVFSVNTDMLFCFLLSSLRVNLNTEAWVILLECYSSD
jgi:hypothetical protein